jgi:DNA (cytosine-5)-methyltransferase 1
MWRVGVTRIACVDLFCGAGGLTHGFVLEGLPVVAGIDLDPACRFPYEANNQAKFVEQDISQVTTSDLSALFGDADLTILAGCAPCQPFSTYAQRYELDGKDGKWGLLYEFARLAKGSSPDVITMENVPTVARHEVFHDFVDTLKRLGYNVWFDVIDSFRYGVPQTRRRMVLLGSKHGYIEK